MTRVDLAAALRHAEALVEKDRPAPAAALLADALAASPRAPALLRARVGLALARAEWDRGDADATSRALDGAMAADPAVAADVFEREARALADGSSLFGEGARRWIEAALARHPADDPRAAFHRAARTLVDARERRRDGDFRDAMALATEAEQAADALGDLPPPWPAWLAVEAAVCRGACLLALGQTAAALRTATRALARLDGLDGAEELGVHAGAAALLAECLAGRGAKKRWRARTEAVEARLAARVKGRSTGRLWDLRDRVEAERVAPAELVAEVGARLQHIEYGQALSVQGAMDAGWGQPVHDALMARAPVGFGLWREIGQRAEPVVLAAVLSTAAVIALGAPLAIWLGAPWYAIVVGALAAIAVGWQVPGAVLRRRMRRGETPALRDAWWMDHVGLGDEMRQLEAAVRDALGARRPSAVATLFELFGQHYCHLGDGEAAARCMDEVLTHAERVGWPEKAAATAEWLAWLHHVCGRAHAAIFHAALAVEYRQRTATRLEQISPEDRRGFLRRHRSAYTLLADLLLARGRITEAERVLGLLKVDELRTFTRSFAAAGPLALGPVEAGWMARYRAAVGALQAAEQAHEAALAARRAGQGSEAAVRAAAAAVDARRATFLTERGALADEMGRADAGVAFAAQDLADAVADLAEDRDPDTTDAIAAIDDATDMVASEGWAVLQYIVTDRRLHLICRIGRAAPKHYVDTRPPGEDDWPVELGRRVAAVRQAVLDRRHTRDLPAARRLARDLLPREVCAAIGALNAPTVLFALDGPLRYLPVAALPHPDAATERADYLLERWAIALYSPAARTALDRRPTTRWGASAFGVTRAHEGFDPLPQVGAELDAIAAHLADARLALDDDFTEDALVDGLRSGRPVLHCATHFRLDPHSATASGLLLGTGGLLTLQALADDPKARYHFADVDLLTLSACQTAFGAGDGREVESLGVIAQRKGAQSVLASLWKVSDEGTSALMAAFYSALAGGAPKAEALRRAQLHLLGGAVSGRTGPTRAAEAFDLFAAQPGTQAPPRAYDAPWFWAAFVLMGHWR